MPKLSLTAKFGIVSAIPTLALALVLGRGLESSIRDRALENAQSDAELMSSVSVEPFLPPTLGRSLSERVSARLDETFGQGLRPNDVASMTVWNRHGIAVYSTHKDLTGHALPESDALERALDGLVSSEITPREDTASRPYEFGDLLEVHVPLHADSQADPIGALEIYTRFAPLASSIQADKQKLDLLLLAGLGLLYLTVFRIVARAAHRLKRQAQENEYQALHDHLTGLPNRMLFRDRVKQALLTAQRQNSGAAILVMDLDDFKEINDSLGHHHGDEVLSRIAERLKETLRETDTIARIGGDEFGILLPTLPLPSGAVDVAEKIKAALKQPVVVGGLNLHIAGSIGIALYPEHGDHVETLVQRADVAMSWAKRIGSGFEIYSEDKDESSPGRLALVGELRRGLEEEELFLEYQPKIQLQSGQIAGVEALARWNHPQRGIVPPSEFIPLAEQTGIIESLTMYVLETALRQWRRWRERGLSLRIAVNLSVRNLLDPKLPGKVADLLDKWQVPPSTLELEITESTVMGDPVRAMNILSELERLGVSLAIDDFGSGYTSLFYLKRLPVSVIKIDQSFVMNMDKNDNDFVIVHSIIQLGRNLGLQVVAEGVETEEAWEQLTVLGCDLAQGFYNSKPMPADEIADFLQTLNLPRAI